MTWGIRFNQFINIISDGIKKLLSIGNPYYISELKIVDS